MTDPDPDPDLDAMSLQDLKQLQKDVAKAIATHEERGKSEARSKLDALAREMGYSPRRSYWRRQKGHPRIRAREVSPSGEPEPHLVRTRPQAGLVRASAGCGHGARDDDDQVGHRAKRTEGPER